MTKNLPVLLLNHAYGNLTPEDLDYASHLFANEAYFKLSNFDLNNIDMESLKEKQVNSKYLEWMLNARRMQDNASPFRLDINYVKELYLEDQLITKLVEKEGSVQYQQVDQNGTTCCSARITQIDNLSC
jgi:acyl-ACP thioesterase